MPPVYSATTDTDQTSFVFYIVVVVYRLLYAWWAEFAESTGQECEKEHILRVFLCLGLSVVINMRGGSRMAIDSRIL